MSLGELPQEFERFVERARVALGREITGATKIVAVANAEKSAAQTVLAELQSQTKSARDQLAALNDELQRRTTLAGLNREIAAASKKLKSLEAETAAAEKALAARTKQITEADARLVGLGLEANRMIAIRTEGEAVMAHLRAQLQQVSIGQRL
jgi:chromosome segregation ATPase